MKKIFYITLKVIFVRLSNLVVTNAQLFATLLNTLQITPRFIMTPLYMASGIYVPSIYARCTSRSTPTFWPPYHFCLPASVHLCMVRFTRILQVHASLTSW
jgi:hypothetical protein